jgi:TRAP-type C4-dicarboxylate transport system substrate-binding protein
MMKVRRWLSTAAAAVILCSAAQAQNTIRLADTLSANDTHNQAARYMAGLLKEKAGASS